MIPLPFDEDKLWQEYDFRGNPRQDDYVRFALTPAIVRHVFSKLGKKIRSSGSSYLLAQCPFHPDRSESFSIRSDGKFLRCFSPECSANTPMNWAEFAKHFGITDGLLTGGSGDMLLQVAATSASLERIADGLKSYIRSSTKITSGYPDRCDPLPHLAWRGLPYEYLVDREAKWWLDIGELPSKEVIKLRRIVFPVRHHPDDDPVSWIAEAAKMKHREKDGPNAVSPKCRNEPGSNTQNLLFGLNTAVHKNSGKPTKTVVLVEGPYDQMRFDYLGVPTAALLGTGSWKSERGRLNTKGQLLLECGFQRVIVCMDRDGAGEACRDMILASLGPWFDASEFKLTEHKSDPGSCSQKDVDRLLRVIE